MFIPSFTTALKIVYHGKVALVLFSGIALTEAFQGQLIIAAIAAAPPTCAIILAAIAMLRGQSAMHLQMNSRLDELVKAKQGVSEAAGVEKERQEERARQSATTSESSALLARAKIEEDAIIAKALLKKESGT